MTHKNIKIFVCCMFVAVSFFVLLPSVFSDGNAKFDRLKVRIIEEAKASRFEDALQLLEESKKQFPNEKNFQVDMYCHIGFGFYQQKAFDHAVALLGRVINDYPELDASKTVYARALIKVGRNDEGRNILSEYPYSADTFERDIEQRGLGGWANYHLAGAYALLSQNEISFLYLTACLMAKDFNPKFTIRNIEKDDDFKVVRNDKRYIQLKHMVLSETFDEAIATIDNYWREAGKTVEQFNEKQASASAVISKLKVIKKDLYDVYTVAPTLIEIQKKAMDYLDQIIQAISSEQPPSSESFTANYQRIAHDIEIARASQDQSKANN